MLANAGNADKFAILIATSRYEASVTSSPMTPNRGAMGTIYIAAQPSIEGF